MPRCIPGKRKPIALAIMLAAYGTSAVAQQQEDADATEERSGAIEEILVTGSFIKGTPLDAPSPVQTIDRASIEAQGAAVVWDVIKNLNVNSGSVTNPGSGDASQTEGTANVNLRNLGENSTLTLINGKRQVSAALNTVSGGEFVDLNAIPLVMTERVEVLTDGGSALYGSDAIAGVVNIIMRTDFEGFEVYGDIQGIEAANNAFDKTASMIWGWASDSGNTNFVLSGERFERDPVSVEYANFFDHRSDFTGVVGAIPSGQRSVISNPAFGANLNTDFINYDIMDQNVAEGGDADLVYTDPQCYSLNSTSGEAFFTGRRADDRGENSGSCRENNHQWNYIASGVERNSFAGAFSHAFNASTEFYSFFQHSSQETQRADDGFNTTRGPTVYLAPSGSHSGTHLGGTYSLGMPMELGYFAAEAGLTRPTAADMPNNPNSLANNGLNTPYYANVTSGWPRDEGDSNITYTKTTGVQLGLRGDFDVSGKSYDYDVGYSWSGSSLEQDYKTFQRDRAELAVNGLGGPDCTPNGVADFDFVSARGPYGFPTSWDYYGAGLTQTFFPGFVFTTRESLSLGLTSNNHGQDGCMFYNPYLTSLTDPELANDPELMEWMNPTIRRTDKRNKLGVVDAVVSGEMFEMAGGTAQFALGAQYRMQTNSSIANRLNQPGIQNAILGYDESGVPNEFHYVSNNYECSMCSFNYDHDRNVKATFLEFSLPFMDKVETQLALRWEDYGGFIGSDLTSKFGISWRPVESLLLRTSYSQSFRAPNIAIVREGLEASGATFRDPIRNQAVRAGVLPATNENAEPNFTYTLGTPAPNVGNETADTYSMGAIWTPGGFAEGLSVQADFWRFEVEDRVLPEPPISAIQHELAAFEQAAENPDNYVYNESLSGQAPVPYESCDPNALAADHGENSDERLECVVDPRTYVVDGVVRSLGSTQGSLITTTLSAINAGTIIADGFDFKTGYRWDNDWGLFNLSLDYTHVRQYKLVDVPGLELGLMESGVFDAAGTTGDGSLVRSLPDNKAHATFNWMYDSHGVTVTNRYVGSYEDLAFENAYQNANDTVRAALSRTIESYSSWDMQYNYRHAWSNENLGTSTFTFGVLDAFNAELPYRESSSLNYDATVFDGRGRRVYARMLLQF